MKRRKDIGGDKEIGEEVMDVIERDKKKREEMEADEEIGEEVMDLIKEIKRSKEEKTWGVYNI